MTTTLDAAVAKLAALSPEDQDRVAQWLLDELADDAEWDRQFAASHESLDKLAEKVRADVAAGRAADLDPDRL